MEFHWCPCCWDACSRLHALPESSWDTIGWRQEPIGSDGAGYLNSPPGVSTATPEEHSQIFALLCRWWLFLLGGLESSLWSVRIFPVLWEPKESRPDISGLISVLRSQWECTVSTDAPVYGKCSGHQKNGPARESPAFRGGQEETAGRGQEESRGKETRRGWKEESRGEESRGGQEEESREGEEESARGEDQVDPCRSISGTSWFSRQPGVRLAAVLRVTRTKLYYKVQEIWVRWWG